MVIFLWHVLLQFPLFADREDENTLWHVLVKEERKRDDMQINGFRI
jgi:hypothetical protein